jgi:hypothetical protein
MRTTDFITDITAQTSEQSAKAAKHLQDIGSLVDMTESLKLTQSRRRRSTSGSKKP